MNGFSKLHIQANGKTPFKTVHNLEYLFGIPLEAREMFVKLSTATDLYLELEADASYVADIALKALQESDVHVDFNTLNILAESLALTFPVCSKLMPGATLFSRSYRDEHNRLRRTGLLVEKN